MQLLWSEQRKDGEGGLVKVLPTHPFLQFLSPPETRHFKPPQSHHVSRCQRGCQSNSHSGSLKDTVLNGPMALRGLPWREHSPPLPGAPSMWAPCNSPSAWGLVLDASIITLLFPIQFYALSWWAVLRWRKMAQNPKVTAIDLVSLWPWAHVSLIYASFSSTWVRVVLYFSLLVALKTKSGPFLSLYWMCYSIASTLYFGFLAERPVGF